RSKVIERRAAWGMGQGAQGIDQPLHDRSGLAVVVAQQHRDGADALDQRRHVGLAEFLAELDQVAFPVAELPALAHAVGAMLYAQVRAEPAAVPAPGMARPPSGAAFGQIAPQLHRLAIVRVGKAVDRLVADTHAVALIGEPAGNLFRRPAAPEALDDRLSQCRMPHELAMPAATLLCLAVRRHTEIAAQFRHLGVLERVPLQFAENGRAMPAELLGNDLDADPGMPPALDLAPFVEVNLRVGAVHGRFLACNKPLISLQSRTSR